MCSILRSHLTALILLLILSGCTTKGKDTQDRIAFSKLPFGNKATEVEKSFLDAGWKLKEKLPERLIFFYPAAIPPELRELPVMGEERSTVEPYTMQVFFDPEGRAGVIILRRFDTGERLEAFYQAIRSDYALGEPGFTEQTETSGSGNQLIESRAIVDAKETLFLVLRSTMIPVEEKLKGGMNAEIEIRIFPKKWNEGITADALKQR